MPTPATASTPSRDTIGPRHPAALPAIDPASGLPIPTLADVQRAREVIASYLTPTPLVRPPALSDLLGFDAYVKCENLQPIGAFKVRGGLYLFSQLPKEQLANGVVTASTGNHGQSIAYAAATFGVTARIHMPKQANPLKVAAMQRLGAEVVFSADDFDACMAEAQADADARGGYFVHTSSEPRIIAGVGTASLEIIEAVPDLDVLFVPVGGGSGACGACIAAKAIRPELRVIAVQAAGAPAVYESWKRGDLVSFDSVDTQAEGLATRQAYSLATLILRHCLDDFRLVSDQDMRRAILALLETTHVVAEDAGAAALAAAYAMRDQLAGQKVAVMLSGGNLTRDALASAIAMEQPW